MRRKQKKLNDIIQGICFMTMLISASAMDSTDITIPTIALLVSGAVLFVSAKLEERRNRC
jgi:hypothetical protein